MWHELKLDAICWLRDASVVRQLPKTTRPLNVNENVAVWVPRCPAKLLKRLYDEGLVLGVMVEEWYLTADRFGFYVYECDDYSEGPYDRTAVPGRPINVKDLPEAARDVVTLVQFDELTFSQTEKLQPSDYVSCFGWGTGWTREDT